MLETVFHLKSHRFFMFPLIIGAELRDDGILYHLPGVLSGSEGQNSQDTAWRKL